MVWKLRTFIQTKYYYPPPIHSKSSTQVVIKLQNTSLPPLHSLLRNLLHCLSPLHLLLPFIILSSSPQYYPTPHHPVCLPPPFFYCSHLYKSFEYSLGLNGINSLWFPHSPFDNNLLFQQGLQQAGKIVTDTRTSESFIICPWLTSLAILFLPNLTSFITIILELSLSCRLFAPSKTRTCETVRKPARLPH